MTTGYTAPKNGFRTFVYLWVSQSVSVIGSALTLFAVNIWLTQVRYPAPEQKPQLAWALSAISLCFALPNVLVAPIAGAWADRHDRRLTMLTADTISGLLSLTLVGLMASGHLTLWLLLPILVVHTSVASFHGSAFDTSYAMLVPEERLGRANGMMMTIWSLSNILSPTIAATLIALPAFARQGSLGAALHDLLGGIKDGTPLAITVDAITFFAAAVVLLFLAIPSPKRTDLGSEGKPKKSLWVDVREGALYIWRRRPMLWLLGTFTMANFTFAPVMVFIPLLVKFQWAGDLAAHGFSFETGLAATSTVAGIGGLVGGFVISLWGGLKRKRIYGVVGGILISGLAQTILGLTPLVFVAFGAGLFSSMMMPVMNAHSQSIWQTQVPRELQGRVFSVRRVIAQCSSPLAIAFSGWAGGRFAPGSVIAVLGGVTVLFCLVQLFNPQLMRVEDKAYLDTLAAAANE